MKTTTTTTIFLGCDSIEINLVLVFQIKTEPKKNGLVFEIQIR